MKIATCTECGKPLGAVPTEELPGCVKCMPPTTTFRDKAVNAGSVRASVAKSDAVKL
jgi:predicted  nucleic acid-binding Zn-ribbon protein